MFYDKNNVMVKNLLNFLFLNCNILFIHLFFNNILGEIWPKHVLQPENNLLAKLIKNALFLSMLFYQIIMRYL